MSNDTTTLSLAEKQALLKQVLASRRAGLAKAAQVAEPPEPVRDDTPASFFRIEQFPR